MSIRNRVPVRTDRISVLYTIFSTDLLHLGREEWSYPYVIVVRKTFVTCLYLKVWGFNLIQQILIPHSSQVPLPGIGKRGDLSGFQCKLRWAFSSNFHSQIVVNSALYLSFWGICKSVLTDLNSLLWYSDILGEINTVMTFINDH